jgi:methionyl aminopeptidase
MSPHIPIKTPEEIAVMREGGKILAQCLQETKALAKPGTPTSELDQFAENFLLKHGGKPSFKGYNGYPATLCTCVNEQVVHAIPSKEQILREGDVLSIDCGFFYKGFHTDATVLLGIGEISKENQRIIKTAEEALSKAIDFLKDRVYLGELSEIIEETIRGNGYEVIEELTGHGIGRKLHEPPVVTNQREGTAPLLRSGMTIAIEPIFAMGSGDITTLNDKWTIITRDHKTAVQIEHTVLITDTGCEILTRV